MTIALPAETWGTYSVRDHCRQTPFVARTCGSRTCKPKSAGSRCNHVPIEAEPARTVNDVNFVKWRPGCASHRRHKR
jgi:hypothetical protein